jgi:colanic acid biosynthesis glycosyl transferase WcaI
VLYAGNIGYLQDLRLAIEAAALLRAFPAIAIVFVGDGPDRPRLEAAAAARSLSNCSFFGFQPHELVGHLYSAGDVGLVSMRKGGGKSSIPSKTWTIMACGRPVVAACDDDSELAAVLRETGAGLVVQPGDAAGLAKAILALYKDRPGGELMGQAGRIYVEVNLSRSLMTGRYERMIRELATTDSS